MPTVITYRGLPMNVLRSKGYKCDVETDRTDTTRLWTHWTINADVYLNPGAIAFTAGRPPVSAAGATPPVMPATTHVAIRQYLEEPRGLLTVQSLGVTLLTSPPSASYASDANNGPKITVHTISDIPGERLYQLSITIETWIREDPTPLLILSNRWNETHDVNEQSLMTRIIDGEAILNAGELLKQTTPADALRNQLLPFTVRPNFQRIGLHVTLDGSGNKMYYRLIDVERVMNIVAGRPAVRVEVEDSHWMWMGSLGRAIGQTASGLAVSLPTSIASLWNPLTWPSFILGPGAAATQNGLNNLPKFFIRTHVRAWGTRKTDRPTLLSYALAIAIQRIYGPNGVQNNLLDTATAELIVSQNTQMYVDVQFTKSFSAADNFGVFGQGADTITTWFANMRKSMEVPNQLTNTDGPNPALAGDLGTRGTALQQIVTQAFEGFQSAPAAPP
jgi:hypothetical protein